MQSKKLLIRSVVFIFLIFLLNYLAMKFYWYSSIWYFDMLMHFLGGIWLALLYIYLFPPEKYNSKTIWKMLLVILLIGLGWEIFEVIINETITRISFNILDTVSDLFFDLSGGCFVIMYFMKKIMPIKGNTV